MRGKSARRLGCPGRSGGRAAWPECTTSSRRSVSYAQPVGEKRYLMTPGPTPVPPEVLAALAEPVVHHRGPDFRRIYTEVLERLQQVCRTESPVLLWTASGTGGFESALSNLVSPGTRVLCVSSG